MAALENTTKIDVFNAHRGRLFGIAYRMLGTRDDAEDILQEAYIRWHTADERDIETPEAWLVTVVTRLSIDRLRKVSSQRETYIGPWLPEPIITSSALSLEARAELSSDLSFAFMHLLERLSPVERAGFLLHDVFDVGYADVANVVGKTEDAVRQIIHRARKRIRADEPRFKISKEEHTDLLKRFSAATAAGDMQTLVSVLSPVVTLTSDGGGKVTAARKVITGSERVARLYSKTAMKHAGHFQSALIDVNGGVGLLTLFDGKPQSVLTMEIENGKITAIYNVMNPDKLRAFEYIENIDAIFL